MHAEKDYKKNGGPPRATGYEKAIANLESCSETYAHPSDMKGKVAGVGPTTIVRFVASLRLLSPHSQLITALNQAN